MKKVLVVGVPKGKKCHDKALCQDVTELFKQMLNVLPDNNQVAKVLLEHEVFKDFKPNHVFIDYNEQDAIDEFVRLYGKRVI